MRGMQREHQALVLSFLCLMSKTGSPTEYGTQFFFFTLAGQSAIPCLYPPVLGLQIHTSTSNFYVGASNLNLGPHFAKQLLLFTKSFPQTQFNVITRGMFMPLDSIVICCTHMYRYTRTHTHIKKIFKNIHKFILIII